MDRRVLDLHRSAHLDDFNLICGSANWQWMQIIRGFIRVSQQKMVETGWVLHEMQQSARWSISLKSSLSGFGTTCWKEMYLAPGRWDVRQWQPTINEQRQKPSRLSHMSIYIYIFDAEKGYISTCYNFLPGAHHCKANECVRIWRSLQSPCLRFSCFIVSLETGDLQQWKGWSLGSFVKMCERICVVQRVIQQ